MTATETFRRLHHEDTPLFLPNAWDHSSGAALAAEGFAAIGTTSLGVAAAQGKRDAQGSTREETVALAERLARLDCLVSVDLEHGFSDEPAEVAELVERLAGLGVVGVNLEDGRADGSLAAREQHASVVAAVKARTPELFVNARTDVFWLGGTSTAAATERARAYVDAGADGIFVPGVTGQRDIAALAQAIPAPLNVLFSLGGPSLPRLAELGVKRVSCGSALFRIALGAAVGAATRIRDGDDLAGTRAPSYKDVEAFATGS
jgi:2-methylisocitrate lyase-like PEP mutase family enzyme